MHIFEHFLHRKERENIKWDILFTWKEWQGYLKKEEREILSGKDINKSSDAQFLKDSLA